MDFVGRTVKKEFPGFGVFSGTIKSFNPLSGYFEIVYEDGDSEEMDSGEITMLLNEVVGESFSQLNQKPRVGRRPKKRRKVEAKREFCGQSGNFPQNLANDVHFDMVQSETLKTECRVGEDLKAALSFNGHQKQTGFVDEINLKHGFNLNDGIDPHEGFNFNDEFCSNEGLILSVKTAGNVKRSESIDLNLDVKGDCDANVDAEGSGCLGLETKKGECHFDLNLGFDDENLDKVDDYKEVSSENRRDHGIGISHNELHPIQVEGSNTDGDREGLWFKTVEEIPMKGTSNSSGHEARDLCVSSACVNRKGAGASGEHLHENAYFGIRDADNVKESKDTEVQVKDFTEHWYKEGNAVRKRRKTVENLKSTAEVVLRRSTRRGSALTSAYNHASSTMLSHQDKVNDCSSFPEVSGVPEENPIDMECEGRVERRGLPSQVQLPPSSQNLNLDGIPVLDVFFVYSCLRSFSTLLFLSPFELVDFVAAVKCKYPTSLLDFIHVSLLQTLRKHLELLSNESSQSAIDCLRGLNWSLLDPITWPVFLANYVLFHSYGSKHDLDINHLKLFDGDYYEQPASVKIEVLRCLCDDVIEVEAIRSELDRRLGAADPDLDFDRTGNRETGKKKKVSMDVSGGIRLMEEEIDETADWNSDECCLCKMDGSLICCDGCPAAYHSKCVGVVNDLLPDGEWYCPECVVDKYEQIKPQKSLRGAELLGVDPHGRLYFSCCDYLLVSGSCNAGSSFKYYQSCDVNAVIEVLKSSDIHYGGILSAISKNWRIAANFIGDTNLKVQISSCSETCVVKDETIVERTPEQIHLITCNSEDNTQEGKCIQNISNHGPDCVSRSQGNPTLPEISGKILCPGEGLLTRTSLDVKQDKNSKVVVPGPRNPNKRDALPQFATGYVNCYSFAQTASSVAEELIRKTSEKVNKDSTGSVEDIISAQLKVILKKSTKFCWSSLQIINVDAQKENCGWCFSCKAPSDDSECLFKMIKPAAALEDSKSEMTVIELNRETKGHLLDIIFRIMSIEDRLRGLLLGPWLNPHSTNVWRQTVLKAPDVKSVKHRLLQLETNLHRLALLDDWLKHVDSANTMGSASHVVTSSSRISSKHGINRKRARNLEFESHPSSTAATGLGLYWWRGGRLSRRLFNWKVLPQSLASRAARQAGCTKIRGILYSDNSDFAKRSKYVAWRAAVEASLSVEQLALQVREFDLNIKWDDIENAYLLPLLDKDSKKSVRSFKKAIIRRKSIEGSAVKYLLDFGKRRFIPDIVSKYGTMLEEKSSARKKYWLDESHVPLHLLKAFEERRISRKSTNVIPGKLCENGRTIKPLKKSGFAYLFARAQRSENHQCGHCNKDVLISEAVSCQHCNGFFHRRHVRKSPGAATAECMYTCHKCWDMRHVKIDKGRRKVQLQKSKIASTDSKAMRLRKNGRACRNKHKRSENNKTVVPLRRSARRAKYVALEKKKAARSKRGKQYNSKKRTRTKPKTGASFRRKRTRVYHTYWLNGLFLSEKPNDERAMHFKGKQLIVDQIRCCLCHEAGDTSTSNLISCDFCGEWFHGDAFGLNAENVDKLIRFKCHTCRKRNPPVCPHSLGKVGVEVQFDEVKNNGGTEGVEEGPKPSSPVSEILVNHKPCSDEQSQGSHFVGENTVELDHGCATVVGAKQDLQSDLDMADAESDSIQHFHEANSGLEGQESSII